MVKWIITLGIGIRIALWCFQVAPEGDDGLRYLHESVNIVRHGVFSSDPVNVASSAAPAPTAHDMPLWPGIMAAVYWATDSVRATQYISGALNIALALCSALLLVSMLRDDPFRFSERQLALSAALFMFMPDSVVYSLFHMPDQLGAFCVILGIRLFFKAGRSYWAIAAFLLAIYAKPICIPLVAVLIFSALFVLDGPIWKRVTVVALAFAVIACALAPWVWRNKQAFGTAGLTTISGANLYCYNWRCVVKNMQEDERTAALEDMASFSAEIKGLDEMKRSQMMGKYARRQILTHLDKYAKHTLITHPRMYITTGSGALLRYLGLDRISEAVEVMFFSKRSVGYSALRYLLCHTGLGRFCDTLDVMCFSGRVRGFIMSPDPPYSTVEKAVGAILQILSWCILFVGYALTIRGMAMGFGRFFGNVAQSADWKLQRYAFLCPICCLLVLAIVIGPVTATRYRFMMVPFFAILAGYAGMKRQSSK